MGGEDRGFFDVAEESDLLSRLWLKRHLASSNNNVRLDAYASKLLNAVLCWLGFLFTDNIEHRNEGDVDIDDVSDSLVEPELTGSF